MKFLSEILLMVAIAIVAALLMGAFSKPRYQVVTAEVADEYRHEVGRQAENLRHLNEYIQAHRGERQ